MNASYKYIYILTISSLLYIYIDPLVYVCSFIYKCIYAYTCHIYIRIYLLLFPFLYMQKQIYYYMYSIHIIYLNNILPFRSSTYNVSCKYIFMPKYVRIYLLFSIIIFTHVDLLLYVFPTYNVFKQHCNFRSSTHHVSYINMPNIYIHAKYVCIYICYSPLLYLYMQIYYDMYSLHIMCLSSIVTLGVRLTMYLTQTCQTYIFICLLFSIIIYV